LRSAACRSDPIIPGLNQVPGEIPCILPLGGFRSAHDSGGFPSKEDWGKLIALARDGSAAFDLMRRAKALVLFDNCWSCQEGADALLLNDDTIRGWHKLFEQRGIEGLTSFDMGGSAGFLSAAQEGASKTFLARHYRARRAKSRRHRTAIRPR
jgi:hypothetical protein